MRTLLVASLVTLLAAAPVAAQEAPEVRPRVTNDAAVPSPEVAARIAQLEDQRRGAEGRASAFGALTIGGTTLIVGGVVAMVVVAVVDPVGCTPPDDCVKPVEDFAPGISLVLVGAACVLTGGILWGDADAEAARLGGEIESLRRDVEPTFSFGPNGFSLGLRARL